jgi:hypothetical protein
VTGAEWIRRRGLLVTRPARTAADLLSAREDPEAVASVVADAIRAAYENPGTTADALAPHAAMFGLKRLDGLALLRWLLDLLGDPQTSEWIAEARATMDRAAESRRVN